MTYTETDLPGGSTGPGAESATCDCLVYTVSRSCQKRKLLNKAVAHCRFRPPPRTRLVLAPGKGVSLRTTTQGHTTLLTLVHAVVVTKVDYCSSVLSGISGQLLQRLQSVFSAAARLVFSARKSEHITPLLRELHWLKVPDREFSSGYVFLRTVALSARRRHTLLRSSTQLPT